MIVTKSFRSNHLYRNYLKIIAILAALILGYARPISELPYWHFTPNSLACHIGILLRKVRELGRRDRQRGAFPDYRTRRWWVGGRDFDRLSRQIAQE